MWTRIINYNTFVRYGVQLGAKVADSQHHKLNFLLLGNRKDRFIFRLDKMLLNYFFNKKLINRVAVSGGNFLFLTTRKEYYDTIRFGANTCSQVALLWRASALSNFNTRGEVLNELYAANNLGAPNFTHFVPDVFVLFDNEKFRSRRLMVEMDQFGGTPLLSVTDTDSVIRRTMFPIYGNDDSCISIHFYSLFVAHCIVSAKKFVVDEHININLKSNF